MALGLTPEQIIEKGAYPLLEISSRWKRVKIKSIAKVQNGFAFSSNYFNKENGLPLIRIRDISKEKTQNLYSGPYSEDFVVHRGDILVGMEISTSQNGKVMMGSSINEFVDLCLNRQDIVVSSFSTAYSPT
ncbi:MAG: restriction endonuclease subunit S [Bacteroidota bacterium]